MFSIEDEKQVVELVRLMGETFIARRDVKAIQGDDGAWMPVTARHGPHNPEKGFVPFTMHDFKMHLEGVSSYGHYLLDTDNNTKLFAFDLDVMQPTASNGRTWTNVDGEPFNPRESWLAQDGHHGPISVQLVSLAMALIFAIEDIFGDDVRVLMCDTGGKGVHIYGVYGEGLMPARVARAAAHAVLEQIGAFKATKGDNFFCFTPPEGSANPFDMIEIEVFPKQDTLNEGGLGNLMALPLGVNRTTGRRREFVVLDDMADVSENGPLWIPADPLEVLRGEVLVTTGLTS